MHRWSIYGFQFVTLSGDQNELFEYLVFYIIFTYKGQNYSKIWKYLEITDDRNFRTEY